jgi:hypothetical protein
MLGVLPPPLQKLAPDEAGAMNDEDRRLALHEAGHAVMAHLFGRRVDIVSIRPGEFHRGVTIYGGDGLPVDEVDGILASRSGDSLLGRYGLMPPLFDLELLGRVSSAVMLCLAGPEAALLLGQPFSGFRDDEHDQERAERLARVLTEPSAEEMGFLEESEREKSPTDEERASSAARALVARDDLGGSMEAAALVQWLRNVTRRIIASDLFAKPCLTLAGQLIKRTTVGREAFLELFEEFQPSEERLPAADQKEEDRMVRTRKDKTGPIEELFAQYMAANPTPRISPEAKVKDLVMCVRRVVASEWGTCPEGEVRLANDPVVVGSPAAFQPLIQAIG